MGGGGGGGGGWWCSPFFCSKDPKTFDPGRLEIGEVAGFTHTPMSKKHLRVVGFAHVFIFCGPSCCEVITWSACGTIGSDQRETTVGTPSRTYSWRYLSRKHFFPFIGAASSETWDVSIFYIMTSMTSRRTTLFLLTALALFGQAWLFNSNREKVGWAQ